MSYIDTFDHEFVGLFANIPLYHPLVAVKGEPDDYDFGTNPKHLVLGGGSGEHPAVVLTRPDYAAALFVSDWLVKGKAVDAGKKWDAFLDGVLAKEPSEYLRFAGWNAKDHHDFYARCRSQALTTPYDEKKDGAFERWLAACLGEFVYFSMPDLIKGFERRLSGVRKCVREPVFMNVLGPTPGYPPLYGRIVKNGKLIWGHSRWWKKGKGN